MSTQKYAAELTGVQASWARYTQSRFALFALGVFLFLVLAAVFGPYLAPQNPYDLAQIDILDARLPPGSAMSSHPAMQYVLGTDGQGRDMLSAMLYGLRISLLVGLVSSGLALVLGLTVGLLAAYRGGWLDAVLMRIADIQFSFPAMLLALVLLAVLGVGLEKIILALVAVQWAYYARTVRGAALAEVQKEYIQAAQLLGLPSWRIVFYHLLPNSLPPVLVVAALQVASAISLEATLSFLGIGLPITEPSLGLLIANGFQYLLSGKYWISLFPGVALLLLVGSINVIADQLRDALNPRLR